MWLRAGLMAAQKENARRVPGVFIGEDHIQAFALSAFIRVHAL
jgi:hypothetical protein